MIDPKGLPVFDINDPLMLDMFYCTDEMFDRLWAAANQDLNNSQLLSEIAAEMNGIYGVIPLTRWEDEVKFGKIYSEADDWWPAFKFATSEDLVMFKLKWS